MVIVTLIMGFISITLAVYAIIMHRRLSKELDEMICQTDSMIDELERMTTSIEQVEAVERVSHKKDTDKMQRMNREYLGEEGP